jgi:hypothetical protein
VLYVENTTIKEDMLFCKPAKRATAKELFQIFDNFVKEKKT